MTKPYIIKKKFGAFSHLKKEKQRKIIDWGVDFGISLEPFGIIVRHLFGSNLLTFLGCIFLICLWKVVAKTLVRLMSNCFVLPLFELQGPPKMVQKHIRDATRIFHWCWIDFGGLVCDIYTVLAGGWHTNTAASVWKSADPTRINRLWESDQ